MALCKILMRGPNVMRNYANINEKELETIIGGSVCSIMDVTCLAGESIMWIGKNIPRKTRPIKCQYVGVTAYSCG